MTQSGQETGGELGRILRTWRGLRAKSQGELSLDTGISQRHLSYIESGRSSPSRQTLMMMADGLDIPFRERNQLLLAAGYAPQYPDESWDEAGLATVRRALERMLAQHEPYPAFVVDRYWNLVMANAEVSRLFGSFIDFEARSQPLSLPHLMFDPQGLRPFIANWPEFSASLFQRIHREAVGGVVDPKTQELLTSLRSYPDTADVFPTGQGANLPVIPLVLSDGDRRLSYFALVATVGTPRGQGAQELRVECMCPVDGPTEQWHLAKSEGDTGRPTRSRRPKP